MMVIMCGERHKKKSASLLGIVLIILVGCGASKDDEGTILEWLEKAAHLAEKHDVKEIMNLTSDDFQAQPGDLARQGTYDILRMVFRSYGKIKVLHPEPAVRLERDSKLALVSIPFVILKKGQPLPELDGLYNDPKGWIKAVGERADLYRLKLGMVKEDGEWLVKTARLEKFTGLGFN
jgi:hypothetical protein